MRTDVYQKITDRIVAELERGVRPWLKPWSAGNTDGRIHAALARASLRPFRNVAKLDFGLFMRRERVHFPFGSRYGAEFLYCLGSAGT
jgi:antirestriction protein ArdC